MELNDWIRHQNGAAHTSQLYAAGFSKHAIADAVARRRLRRVRRSWLLHPECDTARAAAVVLGGRLTCLSAARTMGLWTPNDERVHLAVGRHGAAPASGAIRVHFSTGPTPVARHMVDDALLNVLYHVARCIPRDEALTVWESALRKRLVELPVLRRVGWRSTRARGVLERASELSDAGTETRFVALMREIGVTVRQQARIDGRAVDALIGDKLLVQLDGFAYHSNPADRRRDIEADARLTLRGYTVLRFDYQQLFFNPGYVTETVQMAMAQLR